MPLHLLKLSVGAETVEMLRAYMERTAVSGRSTHTTRMMPRRADELLAGGSLYWVIKGMIAARQLLLDVQAFTDSDGISRCRLVLDATVKQVSFRPFRPFQGWRYLPENDAPEDWNGSVVTSEAMPDEMRRELRSLGLL